MTLLEVDNLVLVREHDICGSVQVSSTVMNIELEQDSTVIEVKGYFNSSHPCTIIVDMRITHNMMLVAFARNVELSPSSNKNVFRFTTERRISVINHQMSRH